MGDKRIAIVSCGSMRPDIRGLLDEGLKVDTVFFTEVCLKERSRELERQLKERLQEAGRSADRILVIYGNACFVDMSDTSRTIDSLIAENGSVVERIRQHSCVEMMLSETEKEELAGGLKTYWMMPAWLEERDNVFFEWDLGKRNQTFPAKDIALMVDAHGFFDRLMEEAPETILEFSDWMGLPLDSREIDLSRFGRLVREALGRLER